MLPQLDTSFFLSQLFWLTISFAILYLFLKYKIIPNFQHAILLRHDTINDLRKEAAQIKQETERLNEDFKASTKKALIEAERMKKETILKYQSEFKQEIEVLSIKYNNEYMALRKDFSDLKDEIIKEDISTKYVDLIINKIICWMKVSG